VKTLFLVVLVFAVLVTVGFGQAPDADSKTGQATVKGCLGGSDGNYTVTEDGTGQTLKITTSSVDLKPHLGHDVKLVGRRASAAVSSGAADSSFAVTELNMISDHCAAAGVAAVATVATVSTSPEAVSPPVPDAATLPATVDPSSAPVGTSAVDAAAPAATGTPSSATTSTPVVDGAAPAATVSPSSATVSTPVVDAAPPSTVIQPPPIAGSPAANTAHTSLPSAHPHRPPATSAAAATAPSATISPSSETVSPAATSTSPPATTASAPTTAASTASVTHRGGSLWLLISGVVLVIVLGTLTPLLVRWRKGKMLEQTGTPNLSFTNEVNTDRDRSEPSKVA
jgi:hypothetical protein